MQVTQLRLDGLRILQGQELQPGPGWNSLVGPNGSGKTSILEGLFLLGHGRSFRRGGVDALIRRGEVGLSVFAEILLNGQEQRLGLTRSSRDWQARVNGEPVTSLGQLFQLAPVLCFAPDSHDLVSGPADERRRFLDWGLFHVEQDFLPIWRQYQRTLRQRNQLLKLGGTLPELMVWDQALCDWGNRLNALRQSYVASLQAVVDDIATALMPELGVFALRYQPGWRAETLSLEEALESARDRDRLQGNTGVGPHRAEVGLSFSILGSKDQLSRGQEKLAALCLRLAQAHLHAARTGDWPLLLLDDLGSELDSGHLQRVITLVSGMPVQRWVTGTERLPGLRESDATLFHVEQGRAQRLL